MVFLMSLDNFRNRTILWDTVNKDFPQPIQAMQGDVNARTLLIKIVDNGTEVDLTGHSLKLTYHYANSSNSGLVMIPPKDLAKGEFLLVIPTEMTKAGVIEANLILLNENKEQVIVSKNLTFISDNSTVTDLAQEVNNNIDDFTKLLLGKMPQVLRSELNDLHAQTDSNKSNIDLKANLADMTSLQSAMTDLKNEVEAFGISPENLVTIKSLLDAIASNASESEVVELINSVKVLTSNISLMSNGDYSPKANQTDLESLQHTVNNQSATISTKANQTDLDNLQTDVSRQGIAISTKADKAFVDAQFASIVSGTPVGSQAQVQYFGAGRINFDFENKLIIIPKNTNIVVGKMVIKIGDDITTAMPTDDYSFVLTVSLQGTNFKCYTSSIINEMSESEVVIAVCNNAQQTVEMNGDYLINGRERIVYAQPVITCSSSVTYKINSNGTMLVTFVKNVQNPVIISYPSAQKRVPVEASYTLKNSEALVYNSRDNSLVALNFDSLFPDSLIIISNYYGKVQNNINAVQGDGDYEYYSDGTGNVIYYGSTVTAKKNGTALDVNFDRVDTRLFYKDSAGNHQMNVAVRMYTVPHNFSLVLNRKTKSLEVINTDNVIRGVHSILISCHLGFAKKVGMYFNSLKTGVSELLTSGKIPINRYQTYVGQDATKVGDEYWLFEESSPDHVSTAHIHRFDSENFKELGLITHNLGHANGVDYRDNTLLVYNGSALPPEINLYKNPDNKMTNLKIQDTANTQIIFKESSKLLPGDGSACFGPDKKIVYYAYSAGGSQVVILKILLGLGDNDLSDKTTDKSDNQHWGSFVSGKSSDEYNGTAQIIASYTGNISGNSQPQGMAFNGDIYLGASHSEQKAYQLQLLDDGSFKVVDFYKSEMTDYKNNAISLEPEITFIDSGKRSLFIGARGGYNSSLSNVAEFNL